MSLWGSEAGIALDEGREEFPIRVTVKGRDMSQPQDSGRHAGARLRNTWKALRSIINAKHKQLSCTLLQSPRRKMVQNMRWISGVALFTGRLVAQHKAMRVLNPLESCSCRLRLVQVMLLRDIVGMCHREGMIWPRWWCNTQAHSGSCRSEAWTTGNAVTFSLDDLIIFTCRSIHCIAPSACHKILTKSAI